MPSYDEQRDIDAEGQRAAIYHGNNKVNIKPGAERDVERARSATLAKLLHDLPAKEVGAHIRVALRDRQSDWSDETLKAVQTVINDLMWERI